MRGAHPEADTAAPEAPPAAKLPTLLPAAVISVAEGVNGESAVPLPVVSPVVPPLATGTAA